MAMTAAQRQQAYRERQREAGEWINTAVDVHAKRALERLARHHGITQRAMLERLIVEAERSVADGLSAGAARVYFDSVTA